MNSLLAILFCCIPIALAQLFHPRFIERFCANENKQGILECVQNKTDQAMGIYQNCVGLVRKGISGYEEMNEFLCGRKMNRAEYYYYEKCLYGAVWIRDMRGEDLVHISEHCLRKYEPPPKRRLILLSRH